MTSETQLEPRSTWLIRGLGLAIVHIAARTVLGLGIVHWQEHQSVQRWVALAVVLVIGVLWAGIDGINDARNHDEDVARDLTMIWLKSAILAGLVAGLISYLVGRFVVAGVSGMSLLLELTAGASFTALLIFIPALVAVLVGRALGRREGSPVAA